MSFLISLAQNNESEELGKYLCQNVEVDILEDDGAALHFAGRYKNNQMMQDLLSYFEKIQLASIDNEYLRQEKQDELKEVLQSVRDSWYITVTQEKLLEQWLENSDIRSTVAEDNHSDIVDIQDKSTDHTSSRSFSAERDKVTLPIKIDEEEPIKEEIPHTTEKLSPIINRKSQAIELRKQADTYLKSQDFENAELYYEKAITTYPKYPTAFLHWGDCLLEQGLYEEAKGKYEESVKLDKNYSYAYKKLGDLCYKRLENIQKGVELYIEAIEHKAKHVQYKDLYSKIEMYTKNHPDFLDNRPNFAFEIGDSRLKEMFNQNHKAIPISANDKFNCSDVDLYTHSTNISLGVEVEVSGAISDHHDESLFI